MKGFAAALLLALLAALGNALYAFGQKRADAHGNPFVFGAGALLLAGLILALIACSFGLRGVRPYLVANFAWLNTSALGYVLLYLGLYFLYRNFGAGYYTLYAMLAIALTSIALAVWVFGEPFNCLLAASLLFALLSVCCFAAGRPG